MPPLNIIVADDHSGIRSALRLAFAFSPHLKLVGEADNGEVALGLAATLQPEVMLIDVNIQPINGVDLTRHLHLLYPHMTLIGFSSDQSLPTVRKMLEAGAIGHITKGTNVKELCARIVSLRQQHEFTEFHS